MGETTTAYLVSLSIDYPDRKLNRLTSFCRFLTVIPIGIILELIPGILFLPPMLMILFRKKYPKWWFDWSVALTKFSSRVCAYSALLRDEYPSTDEDQSVHIEIPYPDAQKDLQRGMPLVKWLLALPHYIALTFLHVAVVVVVVIAWFAILFTGSYPRGLFDFVVGVLRWSLRVNLYAFLLTTDRYPPFRLSD
jgi:hypothetical protein